MFGFYEYPASDDLYRFRRQMSDVFSDFDRTFGLMHQDPFFQDPFFNRDQHGAARQQQLQQQQRLQATGSGKETKDEKYTAGTTGEQKADANAMTVEATNNAPAALSTTSGAGAGAGALTQSQQGGAMAPSLFRSHPHGLPSTIPKIHMPKCDMIENADNYQVTCELPGMTKEDVKLSLSEDGVMTISAERSSSSEQKDPATKYHRMERHYGKFERTIPLPKNIQLDQVTAKHENGLLKISLPKKPKGKDETPKHIQIQ